MLRRKKAEARERMKNHTVSLNFAADWTLGNPIEWRTENGRSMAKRRKTDPNQPPADVLQMRKRSDRSA
jgi:hypothetical protein